MRIDRLTVSGFRNLQDFTIDLEEQRFTTVLIGENGTGKSNLLEAIVLIFRALDLGVPAPFGYDIVYNCRKQRLRVSCRMGGRPVIAIGAKGEEKKISWAAFQRKRDEYLPKYVFAYYSGPTSRLRSYFEQHQKRFYDALLEDESGAAPPIRRLFYCLPEHSRWVLLAYFLRGEEPPEFLRRYFGIEAFDSALLVLRRPPWAKNWSERRPPPKDVAQLGDPRFWWSRGVVKKFLQHLWDEALAPIAVTEDHQDDYRSRPTDEDRLYLYIPSRSALQRLSNAYQDEAALFAALESTDISSLVRDVRVRVRRGGETIVFSELSEGEQQLLTVVGLMQFTRHEESLFLLDEPDTHLNPVWKLRYLRELARHAGLLRGDAEVEDEPEAWLDPTSQLILTTHDPLTIAGLKAQQVQIFQRRGNRVDVHQPDADPRGMGVAGVLIRMFGLPSTLDLVTQDKLSERDRLFRLDSRTVQEEADLQRLTAELSELGLAYEARDPGYRRYLEALHRWELRQAKRIEELPLAEQERLVDGILAELMEASE
ncbi:MAG TPA: AAA family ATPase [Thermoanaerobaculia bacterium]|nr:AAA family ATPase [Thermoanaerobaculia bacterium]